MREQGAESALVVGWGIFSFSGAAYKWRPYLTALPGRLAPQRRESSIAGAPLLDGGRTGRS